MILLFYCTLIHIIHIPLFMRAAIANCSVRAQALCLPGEQCAALSSIYSMI